jgi:hypothetical protein
MTNQPTPTVTDADVERIVRRDFDDARVEDVLALLGEYGSESWHREPARVRLAVLKLAEGREDRLRSHMETANCDYRDVLAPAEYPSYIRKVPGMDSVPEEAEQRIIDADWEQYQEWLTR